MRSGLSRILLLITFWLFVGGVVNVLVAWATCLHTPRPPTLIKLSVVPSQPLHAWTHGYGAGWGKPDSISFSMTWDRTHHSAVWDNTRDYHGGTVRSLKRAEAVLVGVPWRAMKQGYEWDKFATLNPEHADTWEFRNKWLAGSLPLRPVLFGFIMNALFYAVVSWGLWRGFTIMRRRWGRKPWQCQSCRYDQRGLSIDAICPECGSAADTVSRRDARPKASS